MDSFDYKFYLDFYPDLRKAGINSESKAKQHYMNYGINEKRIGSSESLKKVYRENLSEIEKQVLDFNKENNLRKDEELINILIRTSNRPEYFKLCLNSILEQDYKNYRVIICYDKIESLEYLNDYENNKNITFFEINLKENERKDYYWNLYCNLLIDKVEDGWIMFLDDDDKLTHNKVFKMINEHLDDKNRLLIWKFLRPDMLVYPRKIDLNEINIGEISSTSFTFHYSHKNLSKWINKQYGDYYFFKELIKLKLLKPCIIDKIITTTIDDDKVGNFGN